MNNLKTVKFKAKRWDNSTLEVEGNLGVIDHKTLEEADPKVNRNGYLLVIINEEGRHLIDPNSVELIPDPKIEKYDQLFEEISSCYFDENGDEIEDNEFDLGTIGEIAASHFEFL